MTAKRTATVTCIAVVSLMLFYVAAAPPLFCWEMKRQMNAGKGIFGSGAGMGPSSYQEFLETAAAPAIKLSEVFPPYMGYCEFCSERIFE